MRERPILFSAPMVRAILAGTKTQTRRAVKPQPMSQPAGQYLDAYCSQPTTPSNPRGMSDNWSWWLLDNRLGDSIGKCPYGQPGDRLWVRETFTTFGYGRGFGVEIHYAADGHDPDTCTWEVRERLRRTLDECPDRSNKWRQTNIGRWRPSIHMPRWASRITLEITDVRVQRLRDITEDDARAEGVTPLTGVAPEQCIIGTDRRTQASHPHTLALAVLWDTLNFKRELGWVTNPWVWAITFKRVAASRSDADATLAPARGAP
jgi:hypothetical protein